MQPIARVNPKYFAAMNLFAAVQDVRYYMVGVYIDHHPVKGVVMVATDGATLALIHDPDGWVETPIIVGGISKGLQSAYAAKGSDTRRTIPAHLYISQGGAVVSGDPEIHAEVNPFAQRSLHMSKIDIIDGKFPDYRKVIDLKREYNNAFPCVNSAYLARLNAVSKILVDNKYGHGIEFFSSGRDTSMIARIVSNDLEQRFMALLMPMRTDPPKTPLPDWLMPKEEATTTTIETPNEEAYPC